MTEIRKENETFFQDSDDHREKGFFLRREKKVEKREKKSRKKRE